MAELLVIRHGQASFGADNYDQLSALGEKQSVAVGDALRDMNWVPDRMVTGTLERQKKTLEFMGFSGAADEHPGWNEYDFYDLLRVRHGGEMPHDVRHDRRTHFRTLRETVFDWQAGGLEGTKESWSDFTDRIESARKFSTAEGAERVLVVSSGGVIGQLAAQSVEAPPKMMMTLNLQVKNTSITKFIFSGSRFFLHEFNSTPHFATPERAGLMSYS
ncbi:histidine phosphatase family protein [Falsiphaeobacter marinintestinus]|uniref:histidine phosphatase family protein n=1 Tax=Falsiphaeobacter marinintestinus TaxID=1492905 RepID=UPI0011B775B1|nr:histidine phosphatase family protein [Phaeobacter marinintestinus]